MARSPNAQLAVDLYEELRRVSSWDKSCAWHGIALTLLSCEVWAAREWKAFRDCVVYREVNDFRENASGTAGRVLSRAETLTQYLARELRVDRSTLCASIGQYWRQQNVRSLQPHNLVGHAFRSMIVHALQTFGNPAISYAEEVDPHLEMPGHMFHTRSKNPRIDIVARKGGSTVALMSARWRFRHDRVDVVEEALAYAGPARRLNPRCKLYAVVGEFAPNRLDKILTNCPPILPSAALDATVHFAPNLITQGLGENGRMEHLKSLEWLIDQTNDW